jgi:uncharacterized SAM-dependent methyltransferase
MLGHVGSDGRALIGVDICKVLPVLIPAYDDAAGVTARFDLNLWLFTGICGFVREQI